MGRYLLGIDNGGTVTKACIFDSRGRQLSAASRRLEMDTPAPGFTERDMELVWQASCAVIREAVQQSGVDARDICGIGVTGYGNGICFVDGAGTPVGPGVVSTDDRGQAIVQAARSSGLEREIFQRTSQGLWSAQTGTLLAWFKQNRREIPDRARWFLGVKDYIRMRLTGDAYSEITEASSTGLMNLHTMEWDRELFRLLDVEEYFRLAPPCLDCCESGGRVTAQAAALTGLVQGTPVTGAMFDVDCGMLASGILDSETLCLIAGTWSINEYLADRLFYGYQESTNSLSRAFLPGCYLVEESTPTSASNLEWFLAQLVKPDRPDLSDEELYAQCNAAVAGIGPEDCDEVFVPYLFASATHPDAKACFLNLSSLSTRDRMLRAVYEGVAFSSRFHVKRLMAGGRTFRRARLSGGLTRSAVWTQMMADVLQLPIDVPESPELSAQGVCIAAAIGCGLFRDYASAVAEMVEVRQTYLPDPRRAAVYDRKFAAYERAQAALDLFHS